MTTQDEFFGGKGYPSVKFENVGDAFKGVIVRAPEVVPWPSLNPPHELVDNLVICLDPVGSGDEVDFRSMWVKRSKLSVAIRDAYTIASAAGLEVGGTLAVKFESVDPPKQPGHNGAKVYRAKYTPPVASAVTTGDVFDEL